MVSRNDTGMSSSSSSSITFTRFFSSQLPSQILERHLSTNMKFNVATLLSAASLLAGSAMADSELAPKIYYITFQVISKTLTVPT